VRRPRRGCSASGLGPGDPELVTVKAARLIAAAEVIAYHSARHGRSIARAIAEPASAGRPDRGALIYPVTTEGTDHPGGYQGAIDEFYAEAAARLAAHLDAGRDVVVLAEGDPFFYGSYMHMHKRLADRYPTEVVPGVTSVSAAAARARPAAGGARRGADRPARHAARRRSSRRGWRRPTRPRS
jgi:precorrin-2 C20-methyltransferase/precorrin-3B C17-methyltransferase